MAAKPHQTYLPARTARLRIGLLGGSFNPAHAGHLHVTEMALKRLRLNQVWWLVSPGNPLKSAAGMAPLGDRVRRARDVARDRRIRVTDIEQRLGTRFTADTLRALCRRYPHARFVWLMGADNLAQISRWQQWPTIFATVPVAVFDRPSYALTAMAGVAARRFAGCRLAAPKARLLAGCKPPAWVFLAGRLHTGSATRIRAQEAGAEAESDAAAARQVA